MIRLSAFMNLYDGVAIAGICAGPAASLALRLRARAGGRKQSHDSQNAADHGHTPTCGPCRPLCGT